MKQDFAKRVLQHVLSQVQADVKELDSLPYTDWHNRVLKSVQSFVPDLIRYAPDLMREIQLTLNSPKIIRENWEKINSKLIDEELFKKIEKEASFISSELARESNLLTEITGETVSGLIANFLSRVQPDIEKNNRSTYPDLYFKWADYSMLPKRTKANPSGPALKGSRPTSVPDGIEIKSQRGKTIRVDCHHPHQGLHLVLTFDRIKDTWEVYNVFIAYISGVDYRRAERHTTATTEKFSFGQIPFISVLDSSIEKMKVSVEASPGENPESCD